MFTLVVKQTAPTETGRTPMTFGATVSASLHATVVTNDSRITTVLGCQCGIADAIGTKPLLTVGACIEAFLTCGLAQSRHINDHVALTALLVVVNCFLFSALSL